MSSTALIADLIGLDVRQAREAVRPQPPLWSRGDARQAQLPQPRRSPAAVQVDVHPHVARVDVEDLKSEWFKMSRLYKGLQMYSGQSQIFFNELSMNCNPSLLC